MTYKTKYKISWLIGLITMIAPISTVIIINREEYFVNNNSIDLSIGCVIALITIMLLLAGKVELLKGLIGWAVFFLICWFLRTILNDLVLLSGMALSGASANEIINLVWTKKYKKIAEIENEKRINNELNAEADNELMKEEIEEQNIVISGRV